VAAWTGPILAAPAIAFTLALLVADNAKTDAWTLARQNLDTLRGAGGCGLADDVLAAAPASERPPEQLARRLQGDSSASFVHPELRMYFPCIRQPRFRDGVVEVPNAVVAPFDSTSWLPNWAGSPFRGLVDLYPLERLSLAGSRHPPRDVAVFGVERGIPGAALAPAMRRE
jgi:hypothetical protein